MKYAIEKSLDGMIYIPNFMKTGSGIQKLLWSIHIQKHRQRSDVISLLLFFKNKESRLKKGSPYIWGCLIFGLIWQIKFWMKYRDFIVKQVVSMVTTIF
jgi:hypothetical protein